MKSRNCADEQMTVGKSIHLLLVILSSMSVVSRSYVPEATGRRLFGGYRIVPKACQPTIPSRVKSNEPAICMFNYECSRRNGQVVGACMDGFLFGACCQLPLKTLTGANVENVPSNDEIFNVHEIDHVPDIPILLNSDGTPVGMTVSQDNTVKMDIIDHHASTQVNKNQGITYTKISTFDAPPSTTTKSISGNGQIQDSVENSEKPQLPVQPDVTHLEEDFPALLGQQNILDDLALPGLLTHSNNNIQNRPSNPVINPVTTLLSPDQILQIADPVDQLPALFSQGLGQNNHTSPDTILLNENGTMLNETNNPDDFSFKPNVESTVDQKKVTETSSTATTQRPKVTESASSKLPITQLYANTQRLTTSSLPQETAIDNFEKISTLEERVSTKDVEADESINKVTTTPMTTIPSDKKNELIRWVSIDETSKPSLVRISTKPPFVSQPPTTAESFPYTFYKPGQQSSNYYSYETIPTDTTHASYYSTSNAHSLETVHSINFHQPPDFRLFRQSDYDESACTDRHRAGPTRHGIHHGDDSENGDEEADGSFFSVNVKDGTTSEPVVDSSYDTKSTTSQTEINSERLSTKRPTIWTTFSTWSEKPSFHLKPSTPSNIIFTEENVGQPVHTIVFKDPAVSTEIYPKSTTTSVPPHCDEETAAPDDLINFPPVRNPNLNISTPISQQEKPTIVETFNNTGYPDIEILSENDIPTPTFIEDDVLTNKVDTFVNKIMQSLQDNFQDLKDIVYNRANATSAPTSTKRPVISTTRKPLRKPTTTVKPSYVTTKKPATTKRPSINRPTTLKPFASSEKPVRPSKPTTLKPKPNTVPGATTRKPQITTKRPRPTKRPTTTLATSTEGTIIEEETSTSAAIETTTSPQITSSNDFRSQCGIRPLVKSGRIVGGKAATFGEWPWQVLVREATWLGLFTKNKCGGVLITDKYVITAAHCQPGFLATLVAVFGEFDLSGELEAKRSMTRNVRRVIVNRGYNPTTFESDLALLELESPIQFDVHIIPICMPNDGIDFTGRMATVTGWGRLKYNGGVPSVLQEVQVPIIKNSVCQEMFQTAGHSKLILDSFLCAGYANGQKDSCEGDSGGPLVMQRPDGRWFLVGTVSHGITCAAPYLPGVYMRTTYFKPWLQSITGV
ncbi:mucin-12 isoform X1 [Apis mellifera carnica]|nr:mucin-12 isoform X1 [Apis mellifera carnica]